MGHALGPKELTMRTRCPKCQTLLALTVEQLAQRQGLVRCGQCSEVFDARAQRIEAAQAEAPATTSPAATPSALNQLKQRLGLAPAKSDTKGAAAEDERRQAAAPERLDFGHDDPPPPTVPEPRAAEPRATPARPWRRAAGGERTRRGYWIAGTLALGLALAAQALVFYGKPLARDHDWLEPIVEGACIVLPCQFGAQQDVRRIDLLEAEVIPHARYDRALTVRATLVNRADFAQPFPRIEVSLSNSSGQVIARRAYRPSDYLKQDAGQRAGMVPNVAVDVEFDVTKPEEPTISYEMQLLPDG